MRSFTGTAADYTTLKNALVHLYSKDNIKSPNLTSRLSEFARTDQGRKIFTGSIPHYSTIDRLRGGKSKVASEMSVHRSRDESFSHLLWVYIQYTWPHLIEKDEDVISKSIYENLIDFYDAGSRRSIDRLNGMQGRYEVHHFSERLRKPPHAVVRGELIIEKEKLGTAFTATENQSYDGSRFTLGPAEEHNFGYCFFKHTNLVIMMHEAKDLFFTPKWYLFDFPIESNVLTGRMMQLVPSRGLFSSTVYAKKISSTYQIEMNIYHCEEIEPRIMDRLLINDLPGFYWKKKKI